MVSDCDFSNLPLVWTIENHHLIVVSGPVELMKASVSIFKIFHAVLLMFEAFIIPFKVHATFFINPFLLEFFLKLGFTVASYKLPPFSDSFS